MKITNQFKIIISGLMLMLLFAGCSSEKYSPVAINEETARCETCNMAVKDDQFATQIITKDGQAYLFDDIGCMNEWMKENGTDQIGATFVRDYNSKQWIKYEHAHYVYDADIQTPMAYGVISFENEADAKKYVEQAGQGKLMIANDLSHHSWEVNHEHKQAHGKNHDHSADAQHGEATHNKDMHDDSKHTEEADQEHMNKEEDSKMGH